MHICHLQQLGTSSVPLLVSWVQVKTDTDRKTLSLLFSLLSSLACCLAAVQDRHRQGDLQEVLPGGAAGGGQQAAEAHDQDPVQPHSLPGAL